MSKEIPIYFDSVIVSSPIQEIAGNSSIGRLKVRAFTKYGNRNGSYITEEVAEQLIDSATNGMTPVVGFFDPGTKTWASHTGPTLANGYGYVENFLGWEPYEDTDGVTRDYAVFSVVLFTEYFEEAKNIIGQNQSMELDPASIQGDWANIEGEEYYVYTTAKMLGFCVIGSHEPCFSVSAFFSKNDDAYKSQYDKIFSLLFDLKEKVKEAENTEKGGEQQMNEFENQEELNLEENTSEVENPQVQETEELQNFEEKEEEVQEEETEVKEEEKEEETPAEESTEENTESEPEVENNESFEFENLQQQFNDLQASFNQLQQEYETAQSHIKELEDFQVNANAELETLRNTLSNYQAAELAEMEIRKNELIEKYSKIISDEEKINVIKGQMKDFSYAELESKLAIIYANQQMADSETKEEEKVPLPEPPESQFAILMKKYRKN